MSLVPGLNAMYAISCSRIDNFKISRYGAFGLGCGVAIQILMIAVGVTTLVKAFPIFKSILTISGATFILYRGIVMIYHGVKRYSFEAKNGSSVSKAEMFKYGVITATINVNMFFIYTSFFAEISENYSGDNLMTINIVYGILFIAIESLNMLSTIKLSNIFMKYLNGYPRLSNFIFGAIFIAFASKLAFNY